MSSTTINKETDISATSTASETTNTVESLNGQIAKIPTHPAIKANNTTLTITLDFASKEMTLPAFWRSEQYSSFRGTLISALQSYRNISTRIVIWIIFPHYRSQSLSVKECQKEMVMRVAELVNQIEKAEKVDVILRSPETEWSQVKCLVPFHGLRFKGWKAFIKEGDKPSRSISRGSDWDRKLKDLYRNLKRSGEL